MTLTDFLLARIAEDETPSRVRVKPEFVNRVVYLSTGHDEGSQRMLDGKVMTDEEWAEITEPVPPTARVLAECEAKRRIVGLHAGSANDSFYTSHGRLVDTCDVCVNFHADMDCSNEPWPCPTLRALALPYADHEQFQESWHV